MTVQQAHARLWNRLPRFGDDQDIEAAHILGLRAELIRRHRRQTGEDKPRPEYVKTLEDCDRAALERKLALKPGARKQRKQGRRKP